ncbi:MAG: hypothetical protein SGILL_002611, partial [Bacillariaceae sp.]
NSPQHHFNEKTKTKKLKNTKTITMLALSSTAMTLVLFAYVVGCIAVMYFCMLADPSVSAVGYTMQVTVPIKFWNLLQRAVGSSRLEYIQNFMDRALVLMYFIVVGGSWSVVFYYLYPWLLWESSKDNVSRVHAILGIIVFVLCFMSWAVANKSHPGKISSKSFARFDHYPYDNLLFPPYKRYNDSDTGSDNTDSANVASSLLPKVPRSKFDRIKYHCVVPRYDHFCGWTYNTYGEENYRYFLLFLGQHVLMCFYGSYVSCLLFQDYIQQKKLMELTFFDRVTGETVQASTWIVFQYMFARRPLECCVLTVMFVMGIALAAFLGYHVSSNGNINRGMQYAVQSVYLTTVGQTTNENTKWGDIKDWHKRQLAKYERAIKEGKIKVPPTKEENTSIESPPEIDDNADVTSGSNNSNKQQTTQNHQHDNNHHSDYDYDPGPMPKNVYDRGWKENWREVIFPMSKRKDALALGGYTKRLPPPRQRSSTTQSSKASSAKQETATRTITSRSTTIAKPPGRKGKGGGGGGGANKTKAT